ncbi:MAG: diadenylate cyclase CdaA, partial [Draconibacterium sp.]|nr:diadenylate cyclase CdaA [Draconibacterium sp.]
IGSIMGQFIGVGVLALIIVFHPEIRKFLVFVGTNYNVNKVLALDKLLGTSKKRTINQEQIDIMVDACISMSKSHTGALIVITNTLELNDQVNSGERLNAKISSPLIRTIFFKNSPLHDGAVIIRGNRIAAAGCILPLTQKEIDKSMGLRHRAAIGITENSDAVCIIVSEEKGTISFAKEGEIIRRLTKEKLITLLEENIQSVE